MTAVAQAANLGVRFVLEMFVLVTVGMWAWRDVPGVGRYVVPILAIAAVAVLWATVVHGSSTPAAVNIGAQLAVLAVATAAVTALWQPRAGVAFAGVAIGNAGLLAAFGQ